MGRWNQTSRWWDSLAQELWLFVRVMPVPSFPVISCPFTPLSVCPAVCVKAFAPSHGPSSTSN